MKMPPRNQMLTPGADYQTRAGSDPAQESADRLADIDRSGAILANHTSRTIFDMAQESNLSASSVGSALARMADVHRVAAARLDRAALQVTLQIKNARGRG